MLVISRIYFSKLRVDGRRAMTKQRGFNKYDDDVELGRRRMVVIVEIKFSGSLVVCQRISCILAVCVKSRYIRNRSRHFLSLFLLTRYIWNWQKNTQPQFILSSLAPQTRSPRFASPIDQSIEMATAYPTSKEKY